MIKRLLTEYCLGLPGYLISLYFVSPFQGLTWWVWVVYLSVGYWLAYPWLLHRRPQLGITRSMDDYQPPYVKQMTDPDKRAPREPATEQASLGAVVREVGGFGLIQVGLKRWGLLLLAIPWLIVLGVKTLRH
ncbi:hypothetical protein [Lactiplantibacillus modestisalitolerans]|uniref:Integral membrane protein n=1 Tax=Lactiplantibacillus modestisalitolerans TaxID=1457219 RepID=A0ABV5WUM9_9LACO|nr:hypothetical protein [Lactiplantibacillus modestisalitolerans]